MLSFLDIVQLRVVAIIHSCSSLYPVLVLVCELDREADYVFSLEGNGHRRQPVVLQRIMTWTCNEL